MGCCVFDGVLLVVFLFDFVDALVEIFAEGFDAGAGWVVGDVGEGCCVVLEGRWFRSDNGLADFGGGIVGVFVVVYG